MQHNTISIKMLPKLSCIVLIIGVSACGARNVGIIGGEPADIKDFPYMVQLYNGYGFLCGGSIIDEYTILTAAHCIFLFPPTYIRYGNSHVNEGDLINISRSIRHERAEIFPPYYYDIGLLKLKSPIRFGETAQPIKLPQAGVDTPVNKAAILTGWGVIDEEKRTDPDSLQKVNLTVYSDEECVESNKDAFDRPINPQIQICSTSRINGKGGCYGDSGGPLTIDGVQYGVVTGGKKCASNIYPGIFGKVSAYVDWIRKHQ